MDINERVRGFITTNFYMADPAQVRDDALLLEIGAIDSTGVLEVVSFLQREFGVEVADRDLVPENLGSIDRITAYVERMRPS